MKRGRRILMLLLGCGVIGVIPAWIYSRDHRPDYTGPAKAIMGFVPEAMGKERQPGQDLPLGHLASPDAAIVVAPNGVILKDGRT